MILPVDSSGGDRGRDAILLHSSRYRHHQEKMEGPPPEGGCEGGPFIDPRRPARVYWRWIGECDL